MLYNVQVLRCDLIVFDRVVRSDTTMFKFRIMFSFCDAIRS